MTLFPSFESYDLFIALIFGITTYVAFFYFKYFTSSRRLPGPIPFPIIGNLETYYVDDIIKVAADMQSKYGDIWEIRQGSERHVWICRADFAAKLLNPAYTNNNYLLRTTENEGLDLMDLTTKGMIYNRDIDGWISNREFVRQILVSPKFLRHATNETTKLFAEMETYWSELGPETELNLIDWMMRFMTDSTFITVTNERVYALANYYNKIPNSKGASHPAALLHESEKFVNCVRSHFMATLFFKDTNKYLWKLYPPYRRKSKKLLSDVAWLYEKVHEIIKERRKEIRNLSPEELSEDILTLMLVSNNGVNDDTTKQIAEDQVQSTLYEVIGGGIDTTSNSFCYVVYYLAHYPEVKEKMMKEIESVFEDVNDPITYENLKKLNYCEAIIKEASRIMPTVSVLFRVNDKADDIEGHHFDPSTLFKIYVQGIHLHEARAHWKNPKEFDPDRFFGSNAKSVQRNSLLPFGGGSRICPGKQLSMLQMKQLMVLLYRKYDVELVDMDAPIKFVSSVVNHCEELPVRIRLKKLE
ncbi:15483_t:CDS:2 [Acaulospora morrowiae]|uniref:15483_t:CDS:1 n=1 Tax=Acaulospora morrowiae TaxID=94023 RepID=A0A9N9AY10_9GLOM|nr:15483_t:CDS:2 [Acaulospora morrowiae]